MGNDSKKMKLRVFSYFPWARHCSFKVIIVLFGLIVMTATYYHLKLKKTDFKRSLEFYDGLMQGSKFIYHSGDGIASKAFTNISLTYLSSLCLPPEGFIDDVNDVTLGKLVVVTAASSNHYQESLAAIATVQEHFPNNKIMYYDLGLTKDQIQQVKKICGVTYRRFDFTKHPKHVAELFKCTWKPIVILDALCHSDWIIWMDSSIRFTGNNIKTIRNTMHRTGGFAGLGQATHNIFATTYPNMFRYLPMDEEKAKSSIMLQAGTLSFAKTQEVYKEIMVWWVLCALKEDCMAIGKQGCRFVKGRWKEFANCNRFDQSALAIIATNKYHSDSAFQAKQAPVRVERKISKHRPVKMC